MIDDRPLAVALLGCTYILDEYVRVYKNGYNLFELLFYDTFVHRVCTWSVVNVSYKIV